MDFHLLLAQPGDLRRHVVVAFPAAVPAEVLVGTVGIAVAVGPVSLRVVGGQVVQGEAVVRGDVVHALVRPIGVHPVDARSARKRSCWPDKQGVADQDRIAWSHK